jgi:hypothetical protein
LASVAGTFQETLLLAIHIANESGNVHGGLIQHVFEFLVSKDDTVPVSIRVAVKQVLDDTNG